MKGTFSAIQWIVNIICKQLFFRDVIPFNFICKMCCLYACLCLTSCTVPAGAWREPGSSKTGVRDCYHWVVEIEPGFSGKAASALMPQTLSIPLHATLNVQICQYQTIEFPTSWFLISLGMPILDSWCIFAFWYREVSGLNLYFSNPRSSISHFCKDLWFILVRNHDLIVRCFLILC